MAPLDGFEADVRERASIPPSASHSAPRPDDAASEGELLVPADRYEPSAELCVVVVHYNPCGYRSRAHNLAVFLASLRRAAQPHLVVECAFGDGAASDLDDDDDAAGGGGGGGGAGAGRLVRVRARDVLWQKERLLNVALARLPAGATKVAWLDGDVLFCAADWAPRVARALDAAPVVQCFSHAARLGPGARAFRPGRDGARVESFAAVRRRAPRAHADGVYDAHGHTGYAWAARRELLEQVGGFYDGCVVGSGDHMMAHAFVGDRDSACVARQFGANARHRAHFARWATRVFRHTRGRVGCVDGTLLHLWHGEDAARGYLERAQRLAALGFDPERDITLDPEHGCWRWAAGRDDLRAFARSYFETRREDELPETPPAGGAA